jgi:hypothetical protein
MPEHAEDAATLAMAHECACQCIHETTSLLRTVSLKAPALVEVSVEVRLRCLHPSLRTGPGRCANTCAALWRRPWTYLCLQVGWLPFAEWYDSYLLDCAEQGLLEHGLKLTQGD